MTSTHKRGLDRSGARVCFQNQGPDFHGKLQAAVERIHTLRFLALPSTSSHSSLWAARGTSMPLAREAGWHWREPTCGRGRCVHLVV